MFAEAGTVQLNLILDNPASSFISINILNEGEFTIMANELDQKPELRQTVQARLEKELAQKDDKEKLDLLIYQYKDTLLVRLNGKWVQFD